MPKKTIKNKRKINKRKTTKKTIKNKRKTNKRRIVYKWKKYGGKPDKDILSFLLSNKQSYYDYLNNINKKKYTYNLDFFNILYDNIKDKYPNKDLNTIMDDSKLIETPDKKDSNKEMVILFIKKELEDFENGAPPSQHSNISSVPPATHVTPQANTRTTNLTHGNIIDNPNEFLAILPSCNAEEKCEQWIRPINNDSSIGCGLNVLKFINEFDDETSKKKLKEIYTAEIKEGTPFSFIIEYFNSKKSDLLKDYIFIEKKMKIDNKDNIKLFFDTLKTKMIENSCTLVKLNREGKTTGHYILISKDNDGNIYTYNPIYSKYRNCPKTLYKGSVSDSFAYSFKFQHFITASLLLLLNNSNNGENMNINNIYDENKKVFNELKTTIINSTDCEIQNQQDNTKKNNSLLLKHLLSKKEDYKQELTSINKSKKK